MKSKKKRRYKEELLHIKLRLYIANLSYLLFGIQHPGHIKEAIEQAYLHPGVISTLKDNMNKEETEEILHAILIEVLIDEELVRQLINMMKQQAQKEADEERELDEEHQTKANASQLNVASIEDFNFSDNRVEDAKRPIMQILDQIITLLSEKIAELKNKLDEKKQEYDKLVKQLTKLKDDLRQQLIANAEEVINNASTIEIKAPPLLVKAKEFYAKQPEELQPKLILRLDMKAVYRDIKDEFIKRPELLAEKIIGKEAKDVIKDKVEKEAINQLEKNIHAMPADERKEVIDLQMKSSEIQQFVARGCAKAEDVWAPIAKKVGATCGEIAKISNAIKTANKDINRLDTDIKSLENEMENVIKSKQDISKVSTLSEFDEMLKALYPDISSAISAATPHKPTLDTTDTSSSLKINDTKRIIAGLGAKIENVKSRNNITSKPAMALDQTEKASDLANGSTMMQARNKTSSSQLATTDKKTNEDALTSSFGKKR